MLRDNAELAELTRAQIWENSRDRRHLTVHDLRATFVTVSLAEGKSEAWLTDRTGHKSSEMIYRYKRPARAHSEASLGSLVPLHLAIPELAELGTQVPVPVPPGLGPIFASPIFALPPTLTRQT